VTSLELVDADGVGIRGAGWRLKNEVRKAVVWLEVMLVSAGSSMTNKVEGGSKQSLV
jgi:hypothetical protein